MDYICTWAVIKSSVYTYVGSYIIWVIFICGLFRDLGNIHIVLLQNIGQIWAVIESMS